LNECERKLIELTGPAAVDGHSNIAEIGVEFQEPGGSAQIADEEHISDNEENIILTVVDDNDENVVQEPTGIKRKRDRKTTGDILTDAYKQSTNAQKEGLDNISEAFRDIAKAIHRFCDIAESQKEN
jgi:protein-tyrosine-phosphatase